MRNAINKKHLRMIELHWRELLIALISFVFLEIFFQTFSPEFMDLTVLSVPIYIPLFLIVSFITGIVFCKETPEITDAPLDEEFAEKDIQEQSSFLRTVGLCVLYYFGQFAFCYLVIPSFLEFKLFGIPLFNFVFMFNLWLIYNLYKKIDEIIP